MSWKIREISTLKGSDHTYVLVDFLDALGNSEYTEEFIMQLSDTGERVVTDAQGFLALADGSFLDPAKMDPAVGYKFLRETFKVDVPAQIVANIEAHDVLRKERKWTGDHTTNASKPLYQDGVKVPQGSRIMERDTTDPKGILARADVTVLVVVRP